jgi:citrate lyase subunit beta/citryl-CoA lyase
MTTIWPIRSMLFVPAHRPDFLAKVGRFKPDSVVLDLEDAVPPEHKRAARGQARDAIGVLAAQGIHPFIRINALDQDGIADVLASAAPGLAGIMLPKATRAQEVRDVDQALSHAEGRCNMPWRSVHIMPLPETAVGLCDARELAAASSRVCGLLTAFSGPTIGDIARAAGYLPTLEGSEQHYLASKIVLDSRASGAMHPMCSILGTRLDDLDAVRMLAQRAKRFGFTGAVLIHPSHVAVANEVFTPSAEEIEHARGLIAAMREAESQGKGAVSYRGQMVDYAMLPHAEAVVALAERLGV